MKTNKIRIYEQTNDNPREYIVEQDVRGSNVPNAFKTSTGVHPGIGQFLVYGDEAHPNRDLRLELEFDLGGNYTGKSFDVNLLALKPVFTHSGGEKDTNDFEELICADARSDIDKKYDPVSKAYNVYLPDFSGFDPDTLRGGTTEWTWQEIITDLEVIDVIGTLPTEYTPVNIIFDNIPISVAVDMLAAELYMVVGFNLVDKYEFHDAGVMSDYNQDVTDIVQDYIIKKRSGTHDYRELKSMPRYIKVVCKRYDPSIVFNTFDFSERTTNFTFDKNPAGTGTQVLHSSLIAIYDDTGTLIDDPGLENKCSEIAGRAWAWRTQEIDQVDYMGIIPFNLCGKIRSIEWSNNRFGATTTIHFNHQKDFKLYESFNNDSYSYNYEYNGIGDNIVLPQKSGTRIIMSDATTKVYWAIAPVARPTWTQPNAGDWGTAPLEMPYTTVTRIDNPTDQTTIESGVIAYMPRTSTLAGEVVGDPNIMQSQILCIQQTTDRSWVVVSSYMDDPIGTIKLSAIGPGTSIPYGWQEIGPAGGGGLLDYSTNPEYRLIVEILQNSGSPYNTGGEGATQARLPVLSAPGAGIFQSGAFVMAAEAAGAGFDIGDKGGQELHGPTANQHSIASVSGPGAVDALINTTDTSNVPGFICLTYIMRIF